MAHSMDEFSYVGQVIKLIKEFDRLMLHQLSINLATLIFLQIKFII